MSLALPLETMSIPEKLRVMEEIWDNLRRAPEDVPSPPWHEEVLRARELEARAAASEFSEWTDAKRSIRERIR